jgi:murein tripeptide amidase MpaA
VIEKLLAKTKESEFLRKNYIFYVIPMVNIDGVVYGHYRTNLSGKDLNRKWDSSEKETICP